MRFFESQRLAKRNSLVLIFMFTISTMALSWINSLAISLIFADERLNQLHAIPTVQKSIFIISVLAFVISTAFFIWRVPGGPELAESVGGKLMQNPQSENEQMLRNIVEEMSIASGVPVPWIYILESESAINAFAAGTKPNDMTIAVSKGALDQLTRDELQAVIGHEFSHILNEDMSLNMNLSGIVSTFLFFSSIGDELYSLSRKNRFSISSTSNRKANVQVLLLGALLKIFGFVGHLIASLFQSYICKQREFLADASSAQFTRNPESLASVLAKILLGSGSEITQKGRLELAHIFFASGVKSNLAFPTHPPLKNRIKKLVPTVNFEDFLNTVAAQLKNNTAFQKHAVGVVDQVAYKSHSPDSILGLTGAPTARSFAITQSALKQVEHILDPIRNESIARATLSMIILKSQADFENYKSEISKQFRLETTYYKIHQIVESADEMTKITLFHLTLGTLRALPLRDKSDLIEHIHSVFNRDQKISLLEALLLLNAEAILLPAKVHSRQKVEKINLNKLMMEIHLHSENVNLEILRDFMSQMKIAPLLKKKQFIESLAPMYLDNQKPKKEEMRLLCMAINVPIPPF